MESAHDAKDAIMAYREEVVKTIMAYRAEAGEVIQAIPLQILREIENVLPLPTEQKLRGSKEIGNAGIDRLRAVEAALARGARPDSVTRLAVRFTPPAAVDQLDASWTIPSASSSRTWPSPPRVSARSRYAALDVSVVATLILRDDPSEIPL
jgi:hypothetical protein